MMMPSVFGESLFDDLMDFRLRKSSSVIAIRCTANMPRTL